MNPWMLWLDLEALLGYHIWNDWSYDGSGYEIVTEG